MIKGIDVSTGRSCPQWQGAIDFEKVRKSGISFVIIRAGYGNSTEYKDKYFEYNYKNAKAAGLDVGAYWYSYAESVADAKAEAQACLEVIRDKQFEYPIYFDLEEQRQFNKGGDFCDNLVKTFCNELENAGYYAGLYISRSPLQTYISQDVAKRYTLWIAEYGKKCNYSGDFGVWQYSCKGKVSGISGNVDLNYCYKDYPSVIKNGGYNGFAKAESKKTVEEIAKEVLAGKWGNGAERKERLTAAGYDYSAVQAKVNELLK